MKEKMMVSSRRKRGGEAGKKRTDSMRSSNNPSASMASSSMPRPISVWIVLRTAGTSAEYKGAVSVLTEPAADESVLRAIN